MDIRKKFQQFLYFNRIELINNYTDYEKPIECIFGFISLKIRLIFNSPCFWTLDSVKHFQCLKQFCTMVQKFDQQLIVIFNIHRLHRLHSHIQRRLC